jgi:hypothetical protein
MSNEEHASRWIIVIRDEEFIQELEVRLDLGTECHAGFLGPRAALVYVGRQAEMGVCEDRHGGSSAGWRRW